jgi:predicted nucleic acid-binding protein
MTVVDASALVNALVDEGPLGERVRHRLGAADELHAPHLVDIEVAYAVRRFMLARTITRRQASQALDDLGRLNLVRHAHDWLMVRIHALWAALTPYDGAYVALAEALGMPLITCDARLARASGLRCALEVIR